MMIALTIALGFVALATLCAVIFARQSNRPGEASDWWRDVG